MNRVLAGEVPKWARITGVGNAGYGDSLETGAGEGYGYCVGSAFGYGYTQVLGFPNGAGLSLVHDSLWSPNGQGYGDLFHEDTSGWHNNPYSKVEPYKKRRKLTS